MIVRTGEPTTNTNENTPTDRTLTVHVASPNDAFDDVADRLTAIDRGNAPGPLYRVTFHRESDL